MRLHFVYDAQGNRAKKAVAAGASGETTYYVREAGGKVIAIYTKACLDREDFRATVGGGGGASGCIDPAFDDADHDGIADSADNAPGVFNPTQNDADGDDTADVLDADPDGDGLLGIGDPCPYDPLNSCSGDTDSDGIPDASDPCPTWPGDCWTNPDADNDGDGVANKEDNCPWTANADQADTNANGVGDVCECDDEETGGCPPELAEQYVYGSELDGRVVTVRPARARDMQDHRGDTVFTRVLDRKEYELNDHLGNVRARFGDVKKSTGTAGTSPYAIDMKGYVNYYPFGMAQPGREVSMSGGRYGYNGKEMDNEWNNAQGVAGNEGTGNSYDYGARIYDPRVGRWLSGDPMEEKYPAYSSYHYGYCSPIVTIDPNGDENIIVVGTQFEQTNSGSKLMFVHQAINTLKYYATMEKSKTRTMLIFTAGYTKNQLAAIDKIANELGVVVVRVTTAEQVVNYLNSKNTGVSNITRDRRFDLVTNVDMFSHGVVGSIEFGYNAGDKQASMRFDKKIAQGLNSAAFSENASLVSQACRTGLGNDEINDFRAPGEDMMLSNSLAQAISDNANITVYAYLKRSDYSSTLSSGDDRFAIKLFKSSPLPLSDREKAFLRWWQERLQNRQMIDGATLDPMGAVHPVESGSTPLFVPSGMQKFEPQH